MTSPENPFLADLKSTVNVRLLDPLGKSIEGLKYQIREGEKIVAKGITDAQGGISAFTSTIGTELTLHVERFATAELKQVKRLIPWANDFRVKLLSGKVKEKVVVKKDAGSPGNYKRKTYTVKKNDTLGSIAVTFKTSAAALAQLNGLKLTDTIFVDQILKVPTQTAVGPTAGLPASKSPASAPSPQSPSSKPPQSVQPEVAPPTTKTSTEPAAPADAVSAGASGEPDSSVESSLPPDQGAQPETPPVSEPPSSVPKVIPIKGPVVTEIEEDRGENGTPKVTVKLACPEGTCIQEGQSSSLIEEINIRLAGFGGTIETGTPWTKFTAKTKAAVKRFQRDYMKVPETGKVCGGVLRAMDEFALRYPVHLSSMRCPCGVCGGYGRQYTSSAAVNFPQPGVGMVQGIEYPGMHRALLAAFRAVKFYLEMDYSKLEYKVLDLSSTYRCWKDNTIHNPPSKERRWSIRHMGNALDIRFSYRNGEHRCALPHTDKIREEIFKKYLHAQTGWGSNNLFSLETAAQGAKSWVHVDCSKFQDQYKQTRHYAKTQGVVDGTPMVTLAKNDAALLSLLNCGGIPAPANGSGETPISGPGAPIAGPTAPPSKLPSPPAKKVAKKKPATKAKPVDAATVVPISGTRKPIASLTFSAHGLKFLHGFERRELLPYNDDGKNKGFCTIGWGHLVDGLATCAVLEKRKSPEYMAVKNGITEEKAAAIFEDDLFETIDGIVKKCITAPLYQHEFDALVCLAFNAGGNFFKFKNLIGLVNKLDYAGCCHQFADITNKGNKGLIIRRKREMDMFTNSIYNSAH
jgi:GH24 family phage-related lysozyme (muramidase)/LysM repeat protein